MIAKTKSCCLVGIDGQIVDVEVDISRGIPSFEVVGLGDTAVKESKERVRAALKNSHIAMPSMRYVINLAPAGVKKEGVFFDLPIAVGILSCMQVAIFPDLEQTMFVGELSLTGEIRKLNGVLPAAITAKKCGLSSIFVPEENAYEAAVVEGLTVYPCKTLQQIIRHFSGEETIKPFTVDLSAYPDSFLKTDLDFRDVKGQEHAKRALVIAAAGGHNCIMIGSPGTGKTMLAKRLPSILPPLTFEEALEVSKIHSIAGLLPDKTPLITTRPFRSPHHTVSAIGLSGGGTYPRPGEISLAHNGVLFLDELPEFHKDALEILRQPLEDYKITISRINQVLTYPSRFMLVASMNPCKCGYLGDPKHTCTCTEHQIRQYLSKISGPLLDRIDIQVEVNPIDYSELRGNLPSMSSEQMRRQVEKAQAIQKQRFSDAPISCNAQMRPEDMRAFCALEEPESKLLQIAFDNLGFSVRAYDRILKVARTIADIEGSERILAPHIAEAIQYRNLDRKYWKN